MQEATEASVAAPAAPRSPYLKPKAAADFLGTSASTLAKWRMSGRGPVFAVLGKRGPIVYREDDLRAFAEQRRRTSTSAGAPRSHAGSLGAA
jgi:hypothetical protein